ncbi:putative glucan endo-1,3-beta-glucosidase eglC [Colletotrichum sidae]|uniref:Probable glucan endo-1,3-beta-glucosidase eglC n=1 Tax=Colletotrichum sidae TaxID=1347389 RepID=A0A4R8TQC5_9PEZI|nr:putative glucan endo-1,3-beta-glucosidase eglC [Colletotrichum sidae]
MRSLSLTALLCAASTASAFQGFNYGSTFTDGRVKTQTDFESEFKTAASLEGTNGAFTSARLYTMVQGGSTNDPISAIPAAISTKTTLLLGLWASAGDAAFANELEALKKTLAQYGPQLNGLIAGISVGSEDLYRKSPTGIANKEFAGADPDTLVSYFSQVREIVRGSALGNVPIGHVDTWTAWVNGTNKAVIDASDWIGIDAYPYFEDTKPNDISDAKQRWTEALEATRGAVAGKPVWVTETGWPVSGKTIGSAVPSLENARTFWTEVGCPMFGNTNVWWYTFQDASPTSPNPSFGVVGSTLSTKPLYDLSCDKVASSSSSAAASQTYASSSASAVVSASAGASASTTGGSGSAPGSSAVPTTMATASGGSGGSGNGSPTDGAPPSASQSPGSGSGSGSGSGHPSSNTTISLPSSTPTTVPTSSATTTTFSIAFLAGLIALAMF